VFVVAVLYVLGWVFLTQTRSGARLMAVGGNAEAVRRVGVSADRYRMLGFVLSGVCAAVGGIVVMATTTQASPNPSVDLLFSAITAVALSGMPLTGGRGSLPRVLVGALIIATISSALIIRGIPPYWATIATGVLLVLALAFERVMSAAVSARLTAPPTAELPVSSTKED
jgi:ribose transport system permease protein